jgi:hypothetical protein
LHSRISRVVLACGLLLLAACVGDDPKTGSSSGTTPDGGSSGSSGTATGKKIAFVTTGQWDGKLGSATGGIEAGDKRCNEEANLPGRVFVAWLSDSGRAAIDRVGTGPWVLADGTTPVGDRAKLQGTDVKIFKSATGAVVPANDYVWTGTAAGGRVAPAYCDGWSGTGEGFVGVINAGGEQWTANSQASCNEGHHLYCFEN